MRETVGRGNPRRTQPGMNFQVILWPHPYEAVGLVAGIRLPAGLIKNQGEDFDFEWPVEIHLRAAKTVPDTCTIVRCV